MPRSLRPPSPPIRAGVQATGTLAELPLYLLIESMVAGRVVLEVGARGDRGAKRLLRAGAAQVMFADAGSASLPAADASVDVVVCPTALGAIDDEAARDRLLDEARRVLAAGGFLVAGAALPRLLPPASPTLGDADAPGIARADLERLLRRHFGAVDLVAQSPVIGFSMQPAGADEMAVSEALAPLAGEPSHVIAFCAEAAPGPWRLGESLLVPLPEGEMAMHAASLRALSSKVEVAEGEASRVGARAAALEARAREMEAHAADLEARASGGRDELEVMRQSRNRSDRAEKEARAEAQRLAVRVADLEREATAASSLAGERDRALRERDDARRAEEAARTEASAHAGVIEQIKHEVALRRDEGLELYARIEDLQRDVAEAKQEALALRTRQAEVVRERDNLREEILALDDRDQALRAEEERLTRRLGEAETERNELRQRSAELEAARAETARLREDLGGLREDIEDRLRSASAHGAEGAGRERDAAVRRAEETEAALRNLREEIRERGVELAAARARTAEAERELGERLSGDGARSERMTELEKEVTRLTAELAGQRARADEASGSAAESAGERESLAARLRERDQTVAELEARLAGEREPTTDPGLPPFVSESEATEIMNLRRQAAQHDAALAVTRSQNADLEKRLAETAARAEEAGTAYAVRGEAAARFKEEADQARRRVKELVEQLADARAEADRLRAVSASSVERGKLLTEVAGERDRARAEATRRAQELRVTENRAAKLEQAARSREIEMTKLRGERDRAIAQAAAAKVVAEASEAKSSKDAETARTTAIVAADLRGKLAVRDETIARLQVEIEAFAGQGKDVESMLGELRARREDLTGLSEEVKALRAAKEGLEAQLEAKDSELDLLRSWHDVAETARHDDIEQQEIGKTEMAGMRDEATGLRAQIERLRDEAERTALRMSELEVEQSSKAQELLGREAELGAQTQRNQRLDEEARSRAAELDAVRAERDARAREAASLRGAAAEQEVPRAEIAMERDRHAAELGALQEKLLAMEHEFNRARESLKLELEVRSSEHAELLRQLERRESDLWERADEADRHATRIQASLDELVHVKIELAGERKENERLRATRPGGEGDDRKRVAYLEGELKALRVNYAKVNAELTRERYLRKSNTLAVAQPRREKTTPGAPTPVVAPERDSEDPKS